MKIIVPDIWYFWWVFGHYPIEFNQYIDTHYECEDMWIQLAQISQ